MAAKLIPASVLVQASALTVDQVQAAMEHGGARVDLTSAVFLGMMPGGAFIYECKGQYYDVKWLSCAPGNFDHELIPVTKWPNYLCVFKIKLAYDPKILDNIKPEALEAIARAKRRQLTDGWVVCWGA